MSIDRDSPSPPLLAETLFIPGASPTRCRRRSDTFENAQHRAESTRNEIVQQFNSTNAKLLAFLVVCGFVLYHTILRLTHGLDSCKWLLSDGNFRDQVWQPYGCMMHHYTPVDSRLCLRYMEYWGGKNHFVFIGDSRMEQIYHGFIHQISPAYQGVKPFPPSSSSQSPKHSKGSSAEVEDGFRFSFDRLSLHDLSYNDSQLGLRAQFLWTPFTNKSMILSLQHLTTSKEPPSVIIIGSGGYSIKGTDPLDPNVLEDFTASLTHVVLHIDNLAERHTRILWALQEPVDPEKLDDEWTPVTNERIDVYNRQTQKILRYSKADIWSSGRSVAMENIGETPDGFHLGPKTLFHDGQILLNMYCNDNMNYNDATCCSSSEKISKLQIVAFSILLVSFFLACILCVRRKWETRRRIKDGRKYTRVRKSDFESSNDPSEVMSSRGLPNNSQVEKRESYDLFMALAKLTIILSFFFICDRTTMFMKENKYFTQTNFWLPVIYILVLGIFFTEDSNYTKVLHSDQDLEVKGWMVLTILVYNMMGASQVLPIYLFVKTLYSALLFLHGWNQFLSYLQRGDFSLVKLFQDLFRLNVMAILLCISMNRPYQFYEFVPLISYWTVVVYIAFSLPPRITWATCDANSLHYLYLVFKIIGIISFITILYISEVFFEKIFVTRPWKALFVTTDDDIHDWWTRWKIDRYSMTFGMIGAFGCSMARKYKILKDDNHGNLFSMRLCLLAVLFSLGGIGAYGTFSCLCRNQLECLEIHSYVGFIPILCYILLRNMSGILRTRFSAFFAWFGQFWIELLVGQYHVWMGADGHGVLVLVPAYPVGNVLLTAFVFACTAHEVHRCTETLLPFAVPEDWRKTLRNGFVFLLILIPIGVSDGMF